MTSRPQIAMIWAQTTSGVIGVDNAMPWHIPEDFKFFKASTLAAPVIMGRKTWQSLPAVSQPLTGRTNIVISRDPDFDAPGATVVTSTEQAVQLGLDSARNTGAHDVWILGGETIYRSCMDSATRLLVTMINAEIPGDAFAPSIGQEWNLASRQPQTGWYTSVKGPQYAFLEYQKAH